MSPEDKEDLAKKAASNRWSAPEGAKVYEPEAWGDLPIVGHQVPCAVIMVEGEVIRVVSERGLIKSLGGKRGGSHWLRAKGDASVSALPPIISAVNLRDSISDELLDGLKTRYYYKVPGRSGMIANGVRAELYPMICDVYLKARDKRTLLESQDEIAKAADILMRALAHTGIIALIDEATGYQSQRPPDALAKILEAFVAKELQPYIPTFPSDYYEHLFRLRGLDYKTDSVKRPQYFGTLTNDLIYRRLAPGVLAELKRVIERYDDGRPKHKYFQKLTANKGYPKLQYHLGAVVGYMKTSKDYLEFMDKLNRFHPRYGQSYLPFDYESSSDDGRGI